MAEVITQKLKIWQQRVDYQGAILGGLCALVTFILLVGQDVTKAPIAERLNEDREAVLAEVLPATYYDNQPLHESVTLSDEALSEKPIEVYLAKKQGQVSAVVFQIETDGYGGVITLVIALNTQGEILGLRTLSHKETPGLADKIELDKSPWITTFNGESLAKTSTKQWAVKKDGGKFDQFTGATITPRAIVRGVYAGLQFYARHAQELTAAEQEGQKHES